MDPDYLTWKRHPNKIYTRFLCLILKALKALLHLRSKRKHMHKEVYTVDKLKLKATYASAEAYNSGERFESNMADAQFEEILLLVLLLRRRMRCRKSKRNQREGG